MTQIELIGKIKAEIERRLEDYSVQTVAGAELSDLLSFIESLEQSIDADKMIGLDEAAHNHATNNGGRWLTDDIGLKCFAFNPQEVEDAFKAGAKWMAEQGVSVDGEFGIRGVETESIVNELLNGGFKMGDKVIVQIRKK